MIGKSTNTAGWAGTFYVNSNVWFEGSNLYASSDERLKNIKENAVFTLEDVSNIRKVYYTYKNDETNKLELGVIAQDVQTICPQIVSVDDEGYLSVAYDKLSVVALSAIDELYQRVKKLEEKIK